MKISRDQAVHAMIRYVDHLAKQASRRDVPLHQKQASVQTLSVLSRSLEESGNLISALKTAFPSRDEVWRAKTAAQMAKGLARFLKKEAMMGAAGGALPPIAGGGAGNIAPAATDASGGVGTGALGGGGGVGNSGMGMTPPPGVAAGPSGSEVRGM